MTLWKSFLSCPYLYHPSLSLVTSCPAAYNLVTLFSHYCVLYAAPWELASGKYFWLNSGLLRAFYECPSFLTEVLHPSWSRPAELLFPLASHGQQHWLGPKGYLGIPNESQATDLEGINALCFSLSFIFAYFSWEIWWNYISGRPLFLFSQRFVFFFSLSVMIWGRSRNG